MLSSLNSAGRLKRILIIGGGAIGALLVIGLSISMLLGLMYPDQSQRNAHDGKSSQKSQSGLSVGASPLLFGTNLDLQNSSNQVFTSNNTYVALRGMHLKIIRVPIAADVSTTALQEAMRTVKNMGASPLVDLQGVPGNASVDQLSHIVTTVGQIFDQRTIYYEIGNEEDLYAIPVEQYIASWNSLVPVLQQKASQARFVGPVTYHYDTNYLKKFLQRANPLPAAISWHEYACDANTVKDQCIKRLSIWSQHINDAKQVTKSVTGKTLPIMITEWNYAPNAAADDGKITDSEFMNAWTSRALQTLANNQVYAAMQYKAVGSATPLVDGQGAVTIQGITMQSFYQNQVKQPATPPPTGDDGTATATATDSASATATNGVSATATATGDVSATAPSNSGATQTPTSAGAVPTATPANPAPPPPPPPDPNRVLYTQVTSGTPFYSSSLAGQDSGNWFLYTYPLGSKCFFEPGGYGVYIPNDVSSLVCAGYGIPMYSNFAMQVDMTILSGTGTDGGGPSFYDQTVSNNARLQVRVNGSYVLYDGSNIVFSGTGSALQAGLNRTNTVTLIVTGGYTYLYFNGQFVQKAAHTYTAPGTGNYALYVRHNESSTNVVYKNLKIWHA